MFLMGPLRLALQWQPPEAGPPTGGYRIIAIDNERRLISYVRNVAADVTHYEVDNVEAALFASSAGKRYSKVLSVLAVEYTHSYRQLLPD